MSLTNAYTIAVGRIPELFEKIQDGQAPELFTTQLLKDWGFTSTNDRALIPLLKELGFLSPDGKPTSLYHEYRDHSRSKVVMAQGIRNAYGDIFLIKEHPSENDKEIIQGKFKTYHNVSDHVANLMTKTFFTLLKLSDLKATSPKKTENPMVEPEQKKQDLEKEVSTKPFLQPTGLFYNIQIHLPATKDVEVYNAIFKSLREHLIEN